MAQINIDVVQYFKFYLLKNKIIYAPRQCGKSTAVLELMQDDEDYYVCVPSLNMGGKYEQYVNGDRILTPSAFNYKNLIEYKVIFDEFEFYQKRRDYEYLIENYIKHKPTWAAISSPRNMDTLNLLKTSKNTNILRHVNNDDIIVTTPRILRRIQKFNELI